MTPAARVAAAIEVLGDIETRRRPAAEAMKDWGLSHRFAGSGDRAAISSLVYDGLRKKSSSAWLAGEASARGEVIGALKQTRGLDADAIAALFSGEGHAPEPLTAVERERLATRNLRGAPHHMWPATSQNGWRLSSPRASATTPSRRGGRSPSGRRSICERT